jgi:hypothetical protein
LRTRGHQRLSEKKVQLKRRVEELYELEQQLLRYPVSPKVYDPLNVGVLTSFGGVNMVALPNVTANLPKPKHFISTMPEIQTLLPEMPDSVIENYFNKHREGFVNGKNKVLDAERGHL